MSDAEPGAAVLSAEVGIVNQKGLHARAAAKFVRTAETFDATMNVTKDDMTVGGTSILGLMMLAAGCGTSLHLEASGPAAEALMAAIVDLVERGFDEDR